MLKIIAIVTLLVSGQPSTDPDDTKEFIYQTNGVTEVFDSQGTCEATRKGPATDALENLRAVIGLEVQIETKCVPVNAE